ncbi:hypothetical protein QUA35_04025 [Microcoleus sp. N9_B2]|uniref:hypothetical protein n=1 Tax=unclassified Microcoleus TaxID=2642155 RepID=UPI002FD14DFB
MFLLYRTRWRLYSSINCDRPKLSHILGLNLKSRISNQVWGEGEGERAVYKKLKLIRKGDRTQTGMLSYNRTSQSFHTKSETHKQTSKNFQTAKYFDNLLNCLCNFFGFINCQLSTVNCQLLIPCPLEDDSASSTILLGWLLTAINCKNCRFSDRSAGFVAK